MVEGESKLASKQATYPRAAGTVELKWQQRPGHFSDRGEAETQLVGRTRGDQVVAFNAPRTLKGKLVTLEITDAKNMTLFGKLLESPVPA
jgi:hypothetical protein